MSRDVTDVSSSLSRVVQECIDRSTLIFFESIEVFGQVYYAAQSTGVPQDWLRARQFSRPSDGGKEDDIRQTPSAIVDNPNSIGTCHLPTMHSA
jgi:hypothetical protein